MTPSTKIKLLGVTVDSALNFDQHVSDVCSTAFFHIRALRHIRSQIDTPTANKIACSVISSRLDYCNAVLSGMSKHNFDRLQRVQNAAARAVVNSRSRSSVSSILRDLHWLPVQYRVDYKIAMLTFKVLTTAEPAYLHSLLHVTRPARTTRLSSSGTLLDVPFCKSVISSRAFSCCAPTLWNSFPQSMRDSVNVDSSLQSVSVDSFKRMLKTHLFKLAVSNGTV